MVFIHSNNCSVLEGRPATLQTEIGQDYSGQRKPDPFNVFRSESALDNRNSKNHLCFCIVSATSAEALPSIGPSEFLQRGFTQCCWWGRMHKVLWKLPPGTYLPLSRHQQTHLKPIFEKLNMKNLGFFRSPADSVDNKIIYSLCCFRLRLSNTGYLWKLWLPSLFV